MQPIVTPAQRKVLCAIVAARLAWSKEDVLKRVLRPICHGGPGLEETETAEVLLELEQKKLVERWLLPRKVVAWTLTPLGQFLSPRWRVEGIGVEIIEEGVAERPRWAEFGTPRPRLVVVKGLGEVRLNAPELVPDETPLPTCLEGDGERCVDKETKLLVEKIDHDPDPLRGGCGRQVVKRDGKVIGRPVTLLGGPIQVVLGLGRGKRRRAKSGCTDASGGR